MADNKQPLSDAGPEQPTPRSARPPEGLTGWHEPPVEEGSSHPVETGAWYTPPNALPEPEPEAVELAPQVEAPAEPSDLRQEELPDTAPAPSGAWFVPAEAQLDQRLTEAREPIAETQAVALQPDEPTPSADETQPQIETQPQLAASEGWASPQEQQPVVADEVPAAATAAMAVEPDGQQAASPETPAAEQEPLLEVQAEQEAQTIEPQDQEATRLLSSKETPTPKPGSIQSVSQEPEIAPGSTPQPQTTAPQPDSPGLSPAEAALLAEQRARGVVDSTQASLSDAELPGRSSTVTPASTEPQPVAETPAAEAPADSTNTAAFEEVERKVKILRQQYQTGQLTREQFQAELRRLMILGDDGHWWMLGVESDRWYHYDGKAWVASNPPGYEERVRGSAVRTETGVQEVVADTGLAQEPKATLPVSSGEESMLLPKRVPQVDPNATLVSPSTPFLEPVRSSEAATQQKARQVEAGGELGGYVPSPIQDQQIPARPGAAEPTMRSDAVSPDLTIARGAAAPAAGALAAAGAISTPAKPQYRIGEFPQPDYAEALGSERDRNFYLKWSIRISVAAIIGGMALTLIVLLAMIGYYFYKVDQYSGAVASLRDRASNFETTLIMDTNGQVLAEFSDPNTGQRTSVPLNQISPWLIDATVATENEKFYDDPGFSVSAILRAVYQNLTAGGTVSGASTITQQLAKALVLDTELSSQRTAERKIIEIIVASEIKRKYTKNEILEIYLNEIFYGNFAYGIEAASRTYFNKPASDLNPAEAAFLAGLPQSPATYDPVVNREAAMNRMQSVLRLMAEANGTGCIYIQHDDTTPSGIPNGGGVCIIANPQPDGSMMYYSKTSLDPEPKELTLDLALVETATFKRPEFKATHPHFVNYVWQQLEDKYGSQAIYSAGYRVYTTLDEKIQNGAEQSVSQRLGELQARGIDATNASVVVIRPSDGAVIAMVGSADYYNDQIDGQVNVAFTGQQPGSTIKPIVYLAAFEPDSLGRYWTPSTVVWDVYSDFNGYVPTNFDNLYHGPMTVRHALGNSINIPAVKAMNFTGVERFMDMANRFGLEFPLGDPIALNAGLTTALGAVEVRLFDMTSAYATLASNGRRVDPYAILYIQDSKGNEIYHADTAPEGLQVISPEYAYLMTDILSDSDARAFEFGYGWPLDMTDGRPAAVKTGTTNDSRDIWTIGYTPDYAVGVWVGNSDNRPMYGAIGYSGAAPIWNDVMTTAHQGVTVKQFGRPANISEKQVCDDSGAEPSEGCDGRVHTDIFANTAPPPTSDKDIFRALQIDEFTGKLANQSCADDVKTVNFVVIDDPTAVTWINTTSDGNAWATQRNIQTPITQPPTDYCDPSQPRPYVVISNPVQDATVQGVLTMFGTVNVPNFHHYEIRYGVTFTPTTFSDPLVVQTTQWTQPDSPLGQFDTRALQNGQYTLRLIAYDTQGHSVTRDIRINVVNAQATPVPSIPTAAPTLTPAVPDAFPTPAVVTPAPGLAPTWTPITNG